MYKHLSICLLMALILAFTGCWEPGNIPQSDTQAGESSSMHSDPANSISTENLENTIRELSSEKYGGRLTGTKGNELALEYIADYFSSIEINSADFAENFRQNYSQSVLLMNSSPQLSILDKDGSKVKNYGFLDDFTNAVMDGVSLNNEKVLEMVIADDASFFKDRKRDLAGKALLISSEIRSIAERDEIYSYCIATGTQGLVMEETQYQDYIYGHLIRYSSLYRYTGDHKDGFMFYLVEQDVFKDLISAQSKNEKIYMKYDYEVRSSETANIAAMIPGRKSSENLIICAHMDHVGNNLNGSYNPGALDNASGSAAVMELARYFSDLDKKPHINLYFVLFNGEEENLYGSTNLARNSNFSDNNTTVINMDMVGSMEDMPLTLLSSYPHSKDLQDQLADFAREAGIETAYSNEGASDNLPFEMKWIPAVTLIHEDLDGIHYPGDTLDNMDVNRTAEVVVFLAEYILEKAYY